MLLTLYATLISFCTCGEVLSGCLHRSLLNNVKKRFRFKDNGHVLNIHIPLRTKNDGRCAICEIGASCHIFSSDCVYLQIMFLQALTVQNYLHLVIKHFIFVVLGGKNTMIFNVQTLNDLGHVVTTSFFLQQI